MANQQKKTSIGGQALIEGILMRGPRKTAIVVRQSNGEMVEKVEDVGTGTHGRWARLPLIRGVVSFWDSMKYGVGALNYSASFFEDEEGYEPGRFEKWLTEKVGSKKLESMMMTVAVVLGIAMPVALFFLLPTFISGFFGEGLPSIVRNLIEGCVRMVIFFLFIYLTSKQKDVHRTYMYHGAEHKTITCFERGMDLTPENAKKCSRLHDRCGTTFLFLVMAISIFVFSIVNWVCDEYLNLFAYNDVVNFLIQLAVKLLFLPVVAGISYEILKLLAKSQSKLLLPLKAPGFALQLLTTREPDDDMLEVAIAAFRKVAEMDADPAVPETSFTASRMAKHYVAELRRYFAENGIDESDAEWMVSLEEGIPRSELDATDKIVLPSHIRRLDAIAERRIAGEPLWYILGSTEFYGYEIKTDPRALIPRPETELLAEAAVAAAKGGDKLLDLCTGSGCIAVAVAKECERAGKAVQVFAADISGAALSLARENAQANGADISFYESDLLQGVPGQFDIIVCNPPYIKRADIQTLQREVKDFEPLSALDGGEDGYDFYRRLAQEAPAHLAPGGILLAECGQGQAEEVCRLFSSFAETEVRRDLEGVERIVKAVKRV